MNPDLLVHQNLDCLLPQLDTDVDAWLSNNRRPQAESHRVEQPWDFGFVTLASFQEIEFLSDALCGRVVGSPEIVDLIGRYIFPHLLRAVREAYHPRKDRSIIRQLLGPKVKFDAEGAARFPVAHGNEVIVSIWAQMPHPKKLRFSPLIALLSEGESFVSHAGPSWN